MQHMNTDGETIIVYPTAVAWDMETGEEIPQESPRVPKFARALAESMRKAKP